MQNVSNIGLSFNIILKNKSFEKFYNIFIFYKIRHVNLALPESYYDHHFEIIRLIIEGDKFNYIFEKYQ